MLCRRAVQPLERRRRLDMPTPPAYNIAEGDVLRSAAVEEVNMMLKLMELNEHNISIGVVKVGPTER